MLEFFNDDLSVPEIEFDESAEFVAADIFG